MFKPLIRSSFAALIGAVTALSPAIAQQQIGTVAYVEPALRGTPPGGATRQLQIGAQLFADETVSSSASGRAQLIFADQSTLSLGPNTTIVLDTFVFDPASGGGELGVNLAQGTMRFIGGTLSRDDEAVIRTTGATIGIRGSTGIISHMNGETVAIFVAGDRMCINGTSGTRDCTSRQGGVLGPSGYAGRVNPEFLSQIVDMVNGVPAPSRSVGGIGAGSVTGAGAAASGTGFQGTGSGTTTSTSGAQFDGNIFDSNTTLDTVMNAMTSRDVLDPPSGNCVFSWRNDQIYCN
jgi:hypothetical protein